MQNSPVRVLLVEDDKNNYMLIQHLMAEIKDRCFELEWQPMEDARARIAQRCHEVYLIDAQLLQDDSDLLRQSIAPVILLTEEQREIAATTGVVDCLIKGELNAAMLDRSIQSALERSNLLELPPALEEKHLLATAIDHLATSVVISNPTLSNHPIVFANPAFAELTGYARDEIVGQSFGLLWGADTDPIAIEELNQAIVAHRVHSGILLSYRKDGTSFWNEITLNPIFDEAGQLSSYISLQNNVTARYQKETVCRDNEERYALAIQGAYDGIWDWNLKTSEVYFSTRWKSMLGYGEAEVGNTPEEWFDRIHPDDLNWVKVKLSAHLDGLTPHFETEHRMRRRDGSYRWMLSRGLAARDASGATRIAGSQTDISIRKQAEAQLLHDTQHDVLTRLPNRTLLVDRLRHAILLTKRTETFLFAVLALDLDRFKVINDSLGHRIGDQLLVTIAQRLTECLRPADTIARLGGDEFVILLEDVKDISRVTAIADRIQQEVTQPFHVDGYEVFTTVSIGIALSPTGYDLPEDMLRDADIAMYRAKDQGRARYEIFNPSMYTHAVALLQLETDLRRAIERGEFELYYQPIVSLKNNRINGFEALVRWRHPTRGMVSPLEFIQLAEDTGLIIPLGTWVLREACQQMQAWHLEFAQTLPLTISVNLSAKQFTPDLVAQTTQILQETCLPPRCLRLEITESLLMENTESAALMLNQLQKLGIQLSMDDFGTGYSSLSYLHRFPIDILKIDRSFINKIDVDGEQLSIVRTIITLAWNLGMEVVAEGVETAKQLAQLRALQCDCAQGYFFSKPVDRQAAAQLMLSNSPWTRLNTDGQM